MTTRFYTAAEELRPFGDCWVDELGKAYFALNEHREYLAMNRPGFAGGHFV